MLRLGLHENWRECNACKNIESGHIFNIRMLLFTISIHFFKY